MTTDAERRAGCWLAILGILSVIPASVMRGWVLKIIWGWFLVPLGVPAVGIVQALGISALVGMLTHEMAGTQGHKYDDNKNVNLMTSIFLAFVQPLAVLFFCWLIRWVSS